MEYLYQYLVFLAEAVTVVVALLIIISAMASLSARQQASPQGYLKIEKLNDRVKDLRHAMEASILAPDVLKKQHKAEAKAEKQKQKLTAKEAAKEAAKDTGKEADSAENQTAEHPQNIYVLRFEGDVKASAVDHLSMEVRAILTMATQKDRVVALVESPGGMVHSYGLAASQLTRFRNAEVPLTVCVDKVAASGGYLMAAVANHIVAAPFALLGSIGVVAQVPNVHRLLKKNDVDVEVLTAGKYKRTLTMFGENTDDGRQKFVEELEDVHQLFQEFVSDYRPSLDMDQVATGEAWYGRRALDLNLIDAIATSDEMLVEACQHSEVYAVSWEYHKKPIDRFMDRVNGTLKQIEDTIGRFTQA